MQFFKPEIFLCLGFLYAPYSPHNQSPMPCAFPTHCTHHPPLPAPAPQPHSLTGSSIPFSPVSQFPCAHFPSHSTSPIPQFPVSVSPFLSISPNPNFFHTPCPNTHSCLMLHFPHPYFPPIPGPCASVSLVPIPNSLFLYLVPHIPLSLVPQFLHLPVPQFPKSSNCPLHLFPPYTKGGSV